MTDDFSTRVFVENAYYDATEKMLCLILFLKLTGEKRIVYSSKTDWHYHDGVAGDFPDSEMIKFAELIKGREMIWKIYSDPNCAASERLLTEEGELPKEDIKLAPQIAKQLEELNKVFEQDSNIIGRKLEDVARIKSKSEFQQEALNRMRSQIH